MDITTGFGPVVGGSSPPEDANKLLSSVILCGIIGCMAKNYSNLKIIAKRLRKRGLSYNEIRGKINVSKSTLSFWLKSVALSLKQRKKLYTKQIQILSRGPQSQRERRLREIEEIVRCAKSEIKSPLSQETYLLMGAALYWAEGSKGKMCAITNSDPNLILFMTRWIESVLKVPVKNLKARLNIYPQQNELEIKKFWSELTGISLKHFGKSYVKPKNKGYKKNNLYYDTMRIEVPKSSNMRHQIFGWIRGALKNIESDVNIAQNNWKHLLKTSRPVNLG